MSDTQTGQNLTPDAPSFKPADKRRLLIGLALLMVLCVAGLSYVAVTTWIPSFRYSQAVKLLDSGQHQQAAETFSALGGFKDSADLTLKARHLQGKAMLDAGRFAEAEAVFKTLGTYQDCAELLKEAQYQNARKLLGAGSYREAALILTYIELYKDSAELSREAQYQSGLQALSGGQAETAASFFRQLASYKDSAERLKESQYLIGRNLLDKKDFVAACTAFQELGSYQDSATWLQEATYQSAWAAETAGQLADAFRQFNEIKYYKDSFTHYQDVGYRHALLLRDQGDREKAAVALASLSGYKDSRQLSIDLYNDLGASSESAGQYETALNFYHQANNVLKSKVVANKLGEQKLASQEFKKAADYFEEAENAEMLKECTYQEALLAMSKNQMEEGVSLLMTLIELDPESPDKSGLKGYKDSVRYIMLAGVMELTAQADYIDVEDDFVVATIVMLYKGAQPHIDFKDMRTQLQHPIFLIPRLEGTWRSGSTYFTLRFPEDQLYEVVYSMPSFGGRYVRFTNQGSILQISKDGENWMDQFHFTLVSDKELRVYDVKDKKTYTLRK